MKKSIFSFVLACIAIGANAQINETPLKTFNDGHRVSVFNYKNGEQIFLRYPYSCYDEKPVIEEEIEEQVLIFIYDLSFALKKTITFSSATIPGFEALEPLETNEGGITEGFMSVAENLFSDGNFLEFIVKTTDGWAIVTENYQEIFRKRYTDNWQWFSFRLLETKNGNLLEVFSEKYVQTDVECCDWYEGECWYECPRGEVIYMTEIYALPDYTTAMGARSMSIQQLGNPFPNPARTYIQLPYTLPEGAREGTIWVFDVQGKVINTLRVNGTSEYVRLDTSRLSAGNYFYTLDVRGRMGESKRFVVSN